MKLFLDNSKAAQPKCRTKKHFMEIEYPLGNGVSSYIYLLPYGKHDCLVATCFGDLLDFLTYDQPAPAKEATLRHFPTATKLLLNKLKDKNHKTQLCQMQDPKDRLVKWFVCREAEDVDFDDQQDLLDDPDVSHGVEKVMEKSMAVKQELEGYQAILQVPAPMAAAPLPNPPVQYNHQQVVVHAAPQNNDDGLISIIGKIVVSVLVGEVVTD